MSSSVYNHPSTIDDIAYSQPGNNYVNSSGNESSEGKASTTTSMTEHDEVKNEDGYRAEHDIMFTYFGIHGFSQAQADAVAEGWRENGYTCSGKQVQTFRANETLTPRATAPKVAAATSTQFKKGRGVAKPKAPAAPRRTALKKNRKAILSTAIVTSSGSGASGGEDGVVEPATKKRKGGPERHDDDQPDSINLDQPATHLLRLVILLGLSETLIFLDDILIGLGIHQVSAQVLSLDTLLVLIRVISVEVLLVVLSMAFTVIGLLGVHARLEEP